MTDADKPKPSAAAPSAAEASPPAPAPVYQASPQRIAWGLFAPPAMLVGLGWVLAWQQERSAQAVLLPLTPFVGRPACTRLHQRLPWHPQRVRQQQLLRWWWLLVQGLQQLVL